MPACDEMCINSELLNHGLIADSLVPFLYSAMVLKGNTVHDTQAHACASQNSDRVMARRRGQRQAKARAQAKAKVGREGSMVREAGESGER